MTNTKTTTAETNLRLVALFALATMAMMATLLLAKSVPAHASTTFIVNIPGDVRDANTGDNRCDVNSFGTGDQCSLRAAIEQANSTAGADAIAFDIPDDFGTGVHTINVGTNDLGPLPAITQQVSIDGYTQPGASPNTLAVGGDAKLMIELNGTNVGPLFDRNGLVVNASNSTIKGLVINRFSADNVLIDGDGNKVQGNYIGTDPTGMLSGLGKVGDGVEVVHGFNNTIGGTAKATRNVISGNRQGVIVADGSNNSIRGNYIGTGKDGKRNLGNASTGVSILSSNNTVGGTTAGSGNVISGNRSDGVFVSSSSGTRVLGNRIGTTAGGTGNVGNIGRGVDITNSSDTFVGDGTAAGSNTIAFNTLDGVSTFGSTETDNRILSNSIFSNSDSGIDLAADGPTANDGDNPNTPQADPDSDTGPNNLQNFPVLTSAKSSSTKTTIAGKLNSTPGRTFTVQFFSNPSATDEGRTFIGQKSITTGSLGNATFTFSPATKVAAGRTITTTATDPAGSTSEFSAPRTVGLSSGSDPSPETTRLSGPSGITKNPTAHFRFSSPDPVATFECSLDGGAYYDCSSPENIGGLSEGRHAFVVRAKKAGNVDPTPATWIWAVDRTG